MNRIHIFIFLLISTLYVNAQEGRFAWNKPNYDKYPFHFGFAVGYNQMQFKIIPDAKLLTSFDSVYSVESYDRPGFNIHIVGNLRLGENFDLRFIPGLAFGQRDLHYRHRIIEGNDTSITNHVMKVESTHLVFPLYVKYRSKRLNNWRPYLLFGETTPGIWKHGKRLRKKRGLKFVFDNRIFILKQV
jgi:hypothetical protein